MSRGQKVVTYALGFVLGCLILWMIPREEKRPEQHPWHAQTAPAGTYPLRLEDDLGREVVLERQPRHFISLAPSVTETLFAMGMGDHLMAVTRWCDFPEDARRLRDSGAQVGSMDQPDREFIAAYRPDLIIGTDLTPPEIYRTLENPPRTVALVLTQKSVGDILQDIQLIGTATGVAGKALRLIRELEAEREAIHEGLAPYRSEAPRRVLFLLSIEEDMQAGWAPGKDAWVTDLIEEAHGINVAAELGTSWGEVSFEALLALNPEVLLVREGETPEAQARLENRLARLRTHPVWSQVKAVQTGRVHTLPHGPLNIPGPRIMQAYAAVAEGIWGR